MLHPLMLAWITGAVVPLLLHLLSRSQYRPVPWGAMMFISGADAGPQLSARFRQWTLLLLRMMLVGLLAVALARPVVAARYIRIPTAGLVTGNPAAVVIILDDSAGMGYQQNGLSRLDLARQVTLQILSNLKRGDEATLLLAGTRDYQPPLPTSADLQSIAERVADLQPDTGQADFAPDLLRAAEVLNHAGPTDREIYLICDHQAVSWRNMTDGFRRQWRTRPHTGATPRVTVIPVGDDSSDNVAVDGIDFPDHAGVREQSNTALVRVRNYSPITEATVPLSVWTGTRTLFDTTVTIPPHTTRAISVPLRFGEAGSRVISAAVKTTGLTADDRLDCSVDVLDAPRVLVVRANEPANDRRSDARSNLPATRPSTSASAIDLHSTKSTGFVPAGSALISIDRLDSAALAKASVVILNDVGSVSPAQLKSLHGFVSTGGGVLILPGRHASAQDYNQSLLGSSGILNASLGNLVSNPDHLGSWEARSTVFRFLPDASRSVSDSPPLRYFSVTYHGRVIGRYSSNTPAILASDASNSAAAGSGRVVFFNGIFDSNQADAAGLSQIMHSILRHLGTARAVDRNLSTGQPIVAMIDEPVDERSATVQYLSGGSRESAIMTRQNDRTELRYTHTHRPGIYRLRYRSSGKEKVLNFVISAGHPDADLTPLTAEQWEVLGSRIRLDHVDLAQTTVAQAMDAKRGGREIWIELISSVLLLMTLEMLLSRWWSG